jgi:hypothetical protein
MRGPLRVPGQLLAEAPLAGAATVWLAVRTRGEGSSARQGNDSLNFFRTRQIPYLRRKPNSSELEGLYLEAWFRLGFSR